MKIVCNAIVGMLPGYENKGHHIYRAIVKDRDEAIATHLRFIEKLKDQFEDDFVTDEGWDTED